MCAGLHNFTTEPIIADPETLLTAPGKSVLVEAIKGKDLKILEILLDFGAGPNLALAGGITPLRTACELNRETEAHLLLQWGADPNVSASDRAPLVYAIYRKNLVLVISLLKYGADPARKMKTGENALVYASDQACPLEIVEAMLHHEANPNVKDAQLPVVDAARHPNCLRAFLDGKVDLSRKKEIMELAIYHNSVDSVKMLLDVGAIRTKRAKTETLRPELLKILLDNDVDLKNSIGALEMAVHHNSIEAVKMLLDIGMDPNEKKDGVYSPLTTAIRDNRPEILALLLS
ncbi:ankyrin [Acephala macrosclerotiorum]|nr:ankyrin [Acephala macrosclerotiorum]